MDTYQLLLLIRKFRWLYLITFSLTSIIGGYLMIPKVLTYTGESTFYMANESMIDPNLFSRQAIQDPLQVSVSQERIIQLAYSASMMDHLIHKFKLYEHYNIDTNDIYHYEMAINKLSDNMKIDKISTDISRIEVTDRNNEIAAAIANAIVYKLDELNKKYLIDKLQSNLSFYEAYINESSKISYDQNKTLDSYMQLFMDNNKKNKERDLPELEFSIYNAIINIREVTGKIIMAKNLYMNALNLTQSKNLPTIVIIKRAIPDFKSKRPVLLLISVLAGFLCCLAVLVISYIISSYKKEIQILLGSTIPEEKNK